MSTENGTVEPERHIVGGIDMTDFDEATDELIKALRPKTMGIYLVMWYSDKNYSTNVLAAYTSEKCARAHAAPFANGNGLRTGDSVWVKEQVLHIGEQ